MWHQESICPLRVKLRLEHVGKKYNNKEVLHIKEKGC